MRAAIHTLGCRLNQAESALIAGQLTAAGYEIVPFGAPAELGIVHTCTVTREADAKSRKALRQFIRRNPEAFTVVIGCYAELAAGGIAAIPGVDLIIGNSEKMRLMEHISAAKRERPLIIQDAIVREVFTVDFREADGPPIQRRVNLKIQDGCDTMCSFCIVPFARGRSRSRDMDNLLAEARALVARGAKEVVLTGVNTASYDCNGMTLYDAVARLGEIPGLARIRISSIEPAAAPEALLRFMADPQHPLMPFLHVPLQSGSDRILQAMRRPYGREMFLDLLRRAAEAVPGIGIGCDIMVGFPGETDEDFEASCQTFLESPAFYAHIFKYSKREGTAAARMPGQVNPKIAAARSVRLHRLSEQKTRVFQEKRIGEIHSALFESIENGLWTGYTENYLRVAAHSGASLENEIRQVRLTQIAGDVMLGDMVC